MAAFRNFRHYRCSEISSYVKAQELLRQGHSYLDGNGDGEACEALRLHSRFAMSRSCIIGLAEAIGTKGLPADVVD